MGKVRISVVKRTARKLLQLYPDLFTEDYEHNKRVVMQLIEVESKKLRNQIAGYVTRLYRIYKRTGELQYLLQEAQMREAREARIAERGETIAGGAKLAAEISGEAAGATSGEAGSGASGGEATGQ